MQAWMCTTGAATHVVGAKSPDERKAILADRVSLLLGQGRRVEYKSKFDVRARPWTASWPPVAEIPYQALRWGEA